jgi:RNA polymerase sigma factor (sigma-70 family)
MPTPLPPVDPAWAVALCYLPLIRRVAREFRRNPFDTDDLVQEGLIAVHRAVARNDPARDSFGGLANAAAHNRMVDWLRWLRCYGKARPVSPDAAPIADRTDRVDLTDLADVLAMLSLGTDRQQLIVREHFGLYGPARSEAQIAVALGMKRDAVARAKFRALAKVRERLVSAASDPGAARPPCVICGDPDGIVPRSRRTPERLSLARFGLEGVACRRCYIRLYARQKAGSSLGPDVGRLPRGRKRLGVAS